MIEMEQDAAIENEAGAAKNDIVNQNSESSPEAQGEHKPQISENAQQRINELTAEKYALKRQLEGQKQEPVTQELKQEKTPEVAPQLPDNLYDDEAMQKYHSDMIAYTQNQAKAAAQETYQEQLNTQQASAKQAELQSMVKSYAENGLKDGLTVEQMQINEQVLNGSGMGAELGQHIMQDQNGAKIANFLAGNQSELAKVNSMNPMQAAVYIANEVKLKALAPSNVSSAPEPTQTSASGSGLPSIDEFDEKCPGATFD